MELFLAKTLFSVLGFNITPRTILKVIVGIVIAILLWLAYDKIRDHFQHIKDLESQNAQLQSDKDKLTAQKAELEQINKVNATVYAAQLATQADNHLIAATEAAAATARSQAYGDIRNEVQAAPSSTVPIGPATTAVIGSLWGKGTSPQSK